MVLEKTPESPLDCKEIKPVNPKGNQSWIFIERTVTEAPMLWLPDVKNWLLGKTLMLGKTGGRRRRGRQRMRWMWVWASSGSGWWTGKPGLLQSMGSQSDMTEWMKWLNHSVNVSHSTWQNLCPVCLKVIVLWESNFVKYLFCLNSFRNLEKIYI